MAHLFPNLLIRLVKSQIICVFAWLSCIWFANLPLVASAASNIQDILRLSPCAFSYTIHLQSGTKHYLIDLLTIAEKEKPRFQIKWKNSTLYYDPCFDFTSTRNGTDCCKKVVVCEQVENPTFSCNDHGTQASARPVITGENSVSIVYSGNYTAIVDLICSKDESPRLEVVSDSHSHEGEIHLELIGLAACPVMQETTVPTQYEKSTEHVSSTPISVGTVILILGFSIFGVYFFGGMIIRKFIGGATGYEVIPNYEFWWDLPILMKDGAMYLFSGCRPEVVYEQI